VSVYKRTNLGVAALLTILILGGAYHFVTSGGLIARQTPNRLEAGAARWVLDLSVPTAAKTRVNPIGTTDASLTAGRTLYQQKCEVCHGFDGRGITDAGHGEYPPPLDLQSADVRAQTDGELFYYIQNGIRNTPMPGWQLPDQNIWELVAYIRRLPLVAAPAKRDTPATPAVAANYVGSAACRDCHRDIYERWSKTLMANVVRDPKEHPDAAGAMWTTSSPRFA
jgi:mono/diheme cytochrome c family protein